MNNTGKRFGFKGADDGLVLAALLYVSLPVMIFALGWLRLIYGIPIAAVLLWFIFRSWQELSDRGTKEALINDRTAGFWIATFLAVAFWVYLSGIGGLVWQNSDYIGRNPTFRDLCTQEWPIIIDLSKENEAVQRICGSGKVGYTYYFSWWLPVAFLVRVLSLGEGTGNLLLYVYAVAGVFLTVYLICRRFNKCSYWIPVVMIFFSGLDAIPSYLLNGTELTWHIEWWSRLFQYSSNTTQLFWVFNQTIPVWLIVILMLQNNKNRYVIALTALTFAYSPWATIGIIPMVLFSSVKKCSVRELINVPNIGIPLILLVVFGSFYTSGNGSGGGLQISFMYFGIDIRRSLLTYFVFILFEVGLYFIVMGRYAVTNELYYVIFAELLIIPLIIVRDYNFIMRASIPALFMLMLYVIGFFTDRTDKSKDYRIRFAVLLAVFILGGITPMHEINRVVKNTIIEEELLQEDCYSYANIRLEDEGYIALVKDQHFVYDYENKFFYKYLAGL